MSKEFIDKLEEYLSEMADYLENNTQNNIEKINILTKTNELVFWLQMYQDKYLGEWIDDNTRKNEWIWKKQNNWYV